MGPDRTHHSRKGGNAKAGPSTSTQGLGGGGGKKQLSMDKRDPSGVPGVSKLKASIRQTKRFLAKDSLEPALRITTERRLVSLEADLANAQRREVEKKNGAKYHQVKFFEKRKLLRIIKRAKKTLEDPESESDAKGKKKVEKELKEARIMLNYVRHYPNAQKYIALFPSSQETDPAAAADDDDDDESSSTLKLPKLFKKPKPDSADPKAKEDESSSKRRQVLDRISGMMGAGQLPKEPELEVGESKQIALSGSGEATDSTGLGGASATVKSESKKLGKKGKKEVEVKDKDEEDDFFDVDDNL